MLKLPWWLDMSNMYSGIMVPNDGDGCADPTGGVTRQAN